MPTRSLHQWAVRPLAVSATALAVVGLLLAPTIEAQPAVPTRPTAVAAPRDLRVTTSVSGALARSDTTTIVYSGTGPAGRAGSAGAPADEGGATIDAASFQTIAAVCPAPPSTPTTTSTALADDGGCGAGSTTTTTRPSTPPTTSPPPTTIPSPTTSPPLMTRPSASTPPPATSPGAGAGSGAPTSSGQPVQQGAAAQPAGGGTPDASSATAGATQATPSTSPSATITALLDIGAVAGQGTELYRADDEPVVSLLGDAPLFRDLTTGVSDGPDVGALEQSLVEMGRDDGVRVDETFTEATAAAVRSWEEAIGRATPDGSVSVGEVVFLTGPAAVLAHEATIGDRVKSGTPVLTVGTESQVVDARIDATEIADWTVGTDVELRWADDVREKGTVIDVGRDESDGQVAMVVALAPQAITRPIGTAVEVIRVTAERRGVLAVPVSAVVHGPDGPSIRPARGGEDEWIKVELGVVADRWVEIANGLDAGAEVALPG